MTSYLDRTAPDPRDKEHFAAVAMGVVPDTCVLPGALVLGYHETGEDPCPDCPIDRTICKGRPKKEQATRAPAERTFGLEQADDAARRKATRMRWLGALAKAPQPEAEPEEPKAPHAQLVRPKGPDGKWIKASPRTIGADFAPLGVGRPVDVGATEGSGESPAE